MLPNQPSAGPDIKNLIFAIVAATVIMIGWQYFYEQPRMEVVRQQQAEAATKVPLDAPTVASRSVTVSKDEAEQAAPRITIHTPTLHGSINLRGARFDMLTLAQYRESLKDDASEVQLLYPSGSADAYFVELGMLGSRSDIRLPGADTIWQSNDRELTTETPVTLTWNNGAGLTFTRTIAIDEHYLFTVTTTVKNSGASAVTLYPYGLINRNHPADAKNDMMIHEGPLGVVNSIVEDTSYKKLREDGAAKFQHAAAEQSGWIGIADKYWLTALIPGKDQGFDAEFKHFTRNDQDAYQADVRQSPVEVAVGESAQVRMYLFAGAKEVKKLDHYRDTLGISLFDRAIDFGILYFLTRPIFGLLSYFQSLVGNFGLAILALTVVIKLLLFPLANKSMIAMARMKQLTPKMKEIQERYKDDKMRMNQEIMGMYKREKVNPASGCLPILLQLPVFFALYKVLYVTIEMRHAPFFGWIQDLSAADPTNLFNLFGLLPYELPSPLHIGIWPLLMCVTMVIQQRLNPKPTDEVQAMVMNWMPYIFLFMFASFPAGLVIYWAWNNILTIGQQMIINRKLEKKGLR
jgi:YidC/Oxa1 family membrane protein insertase